MKTKYLWLTFGIAFLLAVPLRVYQLLFLMDSTGFYTDGDTTSWMILGILFAATAILVVGSLTGKKLPKRFAQTRNIPSGVINVLLGAGAVCYSIWEIMRLAAPKDPNTSLAGGLLYVAIILSFVGVGAGIVWILNGVSSFLGKNLLRWIPTAGILPPIWMAILLFIQTVQFTGNSITLNNTEQLYDTTTLVFMALFAFNHCKMIAGAQGKKCGKRVYGYGLPMVLFGVISALPGILSALFHTTDAGSFGWLFSLVVLLLSLSAVVFLMLLPRPKDAFEEELVEVPAEEEEAPKPEQAEKTAKTEAAEEDEEELPEEEDNQLAFFRIFKKAWKAIVTFLFGKRKKKKKKVIQWEPGELDEQPTKRLDESWRLDFYGIQRDEADEPYYPEVFDLSPEELERRKARHLASQAPDPEPENEKGRKRKKKAE